jgi:hypothetical protein
MSAELLTKLIEAGTPPTLVAEVAMALGRSEAAIEALEQRRKHERERKAKSRDITGQDVTARDIRDQGSPEVSPPAPPLPNPSNKSPLSPPRSGTRFPSDWQVPPVAELTPKARACAEQWTSASYETEAEGFSLYWQQSRKVRPNWTGTWCAWVIRQHSKVMRDQKFGNAPPATIASANRPLKPEEIPRAIEFWRDQNRPEKVAELELQLEAIRQRA